MRAATEGPSLSPRLAATTGNRAGDYSQRGARPADYARLIALAFPLASARRSSAYAGQIMADCCGDLPSLAADLPAVVIGGPVKRSGPAEAWAQTGPGLLACSC